MERRIQEGKEGKKEGHGEREKKRNRKGRKLKNWERRRGGRGRTG